MRIGLGSLFIGAALQSIATAIGAASGAMSCGAEQQLLYGILFTLLAAIRWAWLTCD